MSFLPLPPSLARRLHREPGVSVLDLGCGDGRFAAILEEHGALVTGLDRSGCWAGSRADVVGDVLAAPLRPGCWPVVTAANLVRHLVGGSDRGCAVAALQHWLSLLALGGDLYVLEDEPVGRTPAERNYRRLQHLLSDMPGRGTLLSRDDTVAAWSAAGLEPAAAGVLENCYALDAARVVDMLETGQPGPGTPAAGLIEDIRRDGLTCGPAWWLRWRGEGMTT